MLSVIPPYSALIDEGFLRYKGDIYHPYHFNCASCSAELTPDAREKNGQLMCLRCHDKAGIPICGACRRPIEERVVNALGTSERERDQYYFDAAVISSASVCWNMNILYLVEESLKKKNR